ncbi:putative capsular polysaccharide synthesis family protein [Aureisphaera galaxeae]|uniref:putative capsular polysaccharide synthesis family protein n=1 Tax=Aureisphaera galaxeae TaxID=1538023 RepID=UPI00234FE314|nr:putative capsular polysaccharide synthesis family protein [Aureisphaera galaxeae]MDC8005764.1 putative capsular polysaccharide synthesis family protein [Aureisphaera galaxeae]
MRFRALLFQIHWRLRELTERINLLFSKDIILVYTMGKVGSTSIYYSLKRKFKGRVLFTHRMIEKNIEAYNKAFIKNNIKPHRSKVGELVLKKMASKNIKIISLVREPIGRNISDFFQDLPVYLKNHRMIDGMEPSDIHSQFLQNYPHKIPLRWFDEEFKETTGIDVFNTPFNKEEKYIVLKEGNVEALVLRVDLDDEKKEKIIGEFLEIDHFHLERRNTASSKPYSQAYNSFKEYCKFNDDYVTNMLKSKYCTHFYSELEISELTTQYENKN